MAKSRPRALKVAIYRGSQRQYKFDAEADPRDTGELEEILEDWLGGQRISRGLWNRYTMEVREDDNGPRVRKTVRARAA